MERNKWEEEFKDKLNQRGITPTPHAWDRLDAMLNTAENDEKPVAITEKPVRRLTWLYVAAGIAAFILVATVFFKQGQDEQHNEVVDQSHQQPVESVQPEIGSDESQNSTQAAETQAAPLQQTQTPQAEKSTRFKKQAFQPYVNNTQIAHSSQSNPATNNQQPTTIQQQTSVQQPDTQIAAIEPQIQQPKNVKVDARSLLSQVDGELDMTFREKAIKTIRKNYKEVKVALANRNNQQ